MAESLQSGSFKYYTIGSMTKIAGMSSTDSESASLPLSMSSDNGCYFIDLLIEERISKVDFHPLNGCVSANTIFTVALPSTYLRHWWSG